MRGMIATLFVLVAGTAAAQTAPPVSPGIPDGKSLLAAKCGRCHALDATSASPFDQAPPFRDVVAKFPAEELRLRLSEGVVSHFKDMPQIDFTEEEVTGILDYLSTLAAR